MNTRGVFTRAGTALAAAATLTVLLLFVAVPRSRAEDRAQCQRNIEQAEAKLDQAIRKYGEYSKQANNWRENLNIVRERCWNAHHAWWDGREHQWHTEHDWDRGHDHDKDHH